LNFHNSKTRKIVSGIIVALLIVAMVLPMLLSVIY